MFDSPAVGASTLKEMGATDSLTFVSTRLPTNFAESTTINHLSTTSTGKNDGIAFCLQVYLLLMHVPLY